jgi:hypothetical protein
MNITLAWPPTVLDPPDGFALSEIPQKHVTSTLMSQSRLLAAGVLDRLIGQTVCGELSRKIL